MKRLTTSTTLALLALTSLSGLNATPPTYHVVELTSSGASVASATENASVAGYRAGSTAVTGNRATLWTPSGAVDLHPSLAVSATNPGYSAVNDMWLGVQVGYAGGGTANGRSQPVLWRGSALSAVQLSAGFLISGGEAVGTDGVQAVGYVNAQNAEDPTIQVGTAMLWNTATGAPTRLGDGKNPSRANGVGGGKQVGFVSKGSVFAALWSGTEKSLVSLQPTGAVTSTAYDTDGVRQVGYAGYDIRVRAEAAKGNKDQRFNYATVWTGTAASAQIIHPYPVNAVAGVTYTHSYAISVRGTWIVGHCTDMTKSGSPAIYRAIVWDADYQSADLNVYLPSGYIGAQATSVDADGLISGIAWTAAGERRAILWVPNP